MRLWILIFVFYIYQAIADKESEIEEYEYDEAAEDIEDDGTGVRLVGASRGNAEVLTFLVGYNTMFHEKDKTSCTGSLITSSWIVSAAHCIIHIIPLNETNKCLQLTEQNKVYSRVHRVDAKGTTVKQDFQCHHIARGNLKVTFVNEPGIAYVGIENVLDEKEVANGERVEIDFFVRHANTYRGGGGYGKYGGYDVTLLHLSKSVPAKYKPACLPGPHYQDSGIGPHYKGEEKANLAGFGRYRRAPCMTDKYGPSKFHYCANECIDSREPPSHPICKKFFEDPSTPDAIPEDNEELFIETAGGPAGCYRSQSPLPESHGWCRVNQTVHRIGGLKEKDNTWGFCGRDCYLPERNIEPDASVLRQVKNVDVLDDALCNAFLQSSIGSVKFMPQILCIGRVEEPKFTVFQYEQNRFRKGSSSKFKHPLTLIKRKDMYVRSAGTCNGDSGGPVFTLDDDSGRFVTLGAVSGGRGSLGQCGGLNNPTHYARLKMFVPWIKLILGPDVEDLCIID